MEYLDKLSKSIKSLEETSDKISKIPEILSSVVALTQEVEEEKIKVQQSQNKLDKIIDELQKEIDTLEIVTKKNETCFQETIQLIREELVKSKKENVRAVTVAMKHHFDENEKTMNKLNSTLKNVIIIATTGTLLSAISVFYLIAY